MGNCKCSVLVHLDPDAIAVVDTLATSMEELLTKHEHRLVGHPTDETDVRESVKALLDRNKYFPSQPSWTPQELEDQLAPIVSAFAQEYQSRRQIHNVELLDAQAGKPKPSCVRWEWVNGEIECQYNYRVKLTAADPESPDAIDASQEIANETGGTGSYRMQVHLTGHYVGDVASATPPVLSEVGGNNEPPPQPREGGAD